MFGEIELFALEEEQNAFNREKGEKFLASRNKALIVSLYRAAKQYDLE